MSWLEMWSRLMRGRNKGQVLDRCFGKMSEWLRDAPCLSAGEVDQRVLMPFTRALGKHHSFWPLSYLPTSLGLSTFQNLPL